MRGSHIKWVKIRVHLSIMRRSLINCFFIRRFWRSSVINSNTPPQAKRLEIPNAQLGTQECECRTPKTFGEYISNLLSCRYILKPELFGTYQFTHKVVIKLDVFGPIVRDRICGKENCTLIVAEDYWGC